MSKNIEQIYIANPITSNSSLDLMYFGQSPYGPTNDAAMTFANFAAQFSAPITPAALTRTNDTNVTATLGGTPASALLQAVSLTLGWTGQLSGARGGTGVANTGLTINLGSATTGYVLTSDSSGNGTWQVLPSSAVTFAGDSGQGTPFTTNAPVIQAGFSSLLCGSSVWFDATSPNITLNLSDSNGNTILGSYSGTSGLLGSGGGANTVIGSGSFDSVNGPATNNILIGYSVANAYTNQESGNIIISNSFPGTPGQNNTTVIGFSGGIPTTTACYIDGVQGISVSNLNLVTIDTSTGQLGSEAASSVYTTFTGNTGTPFSGNAITFDATNQSSTSYFNASSPNMVLNFEDGNKNISIGIGGLPAPGSSTNVISIGDGAFNSGAGATYSIAIGHSALQHGAAANNIAIGESVGYALTGGNNTIVGAYAMTGAGSAGASNNIAIGYQAGMNISTGTESGNILIGHLGVNGVSDSIHLGTFATQTSCYIAGIAGIAVAPAHLNLATINTITGQMGSEDPSSLQTLFAGDSGQGISFQTSSVTIQANFASQGCGSSVWFDATTPNITLNVSDSNQNTIIGQAAGTAALSTMGGSLNTVIGAAAFNVIGNAATNNVIVGYASGTAYTTFETSNILIGSQLPGNTGENNTTRIGFLTGLTSQTGCYIDGIAGQPFLAGSPTPATVIIDTSTGQLISSSTPFATPWTSEASPFGALAGNGYFISASIIASLPSPAVNGDNVQLVSVSGTNIIQAGIGDIIQIGTGTSSSGGTATASTNGASINLVYDLATTTWFSVGAPQSTWTLA